MQLLETIGPPAAETAPTQTVRRVMRRWLTGRRGLIVAGAAIVAAGLALGWSWLTAIGVAPVILSLAPCAAMCAIGACAMRKGNSAAVKPDACQQATTPDSASTPSRSSEQGL